MIKKLVAPYTAPVLAAISFLVLLPNQCHSTTVVVIINNNGIVIASDSKIAPVGLGEAKYGRKVLIIKDRIAIAGLGDEAFSFDTPSTHVIDYEFATWVHSFEGSLPASASLNDVVHIVDNKFQQMIPRLNFVIASGGMQPNDPVDRFEPYMKYLVAGYQDGRPVLSVEEFYIDWKAKNVPEPTIHPEADDNIDWHTRMHFYGVTQALTNLGNRNSYAHKRIMTLCPKAFQDYISRRPISFNETIDLARALVRIEEETNPNEVGGDVRIVHILPSGRASDLVNDLSKPKRPAQQGKQ